MDAVFFVAYWLFISTLIVHHVDGFPNGAPTAACATMQPGHSVDPQPVSTSPFFTHILNRETASMDNVVRLELGDRSGSGTFKGFLVMAFDKDDTSTTPKPIGTFDVPSGGRLISCTDGIQNAVTHTLNNDKKSVKVDWIRPKSFTGQVIFRTTFVQDFNTFWVKTESKPVSFALDQPTITPELLFATQPQLNLTVSTATPSSTQLLTGSTTTKDLGASHFHRCWIMKMNMMNIWHLGLVKDQRQACVLPMLAEALQFVIIL